MQKKLQFFFNYKKVKTNIFYKTQVSVFYPVFLPKLDYENLNNQKSPIITMLTPGDRIGPNKVRFSIIIFVE